jgi:hypothetical protein
MGFFSKPRRHLGGGDARFGIGGNPGAGLLLPSVIDIGCPSSIFQHLIILLCLTIRDLRALQGQ